MSDKKEAEKIKDATTRRYEKSIEAASFLGGLTIALLVLLITPSDNSLGAVGHTVFCSKPVSPFCNFITNVLKSDYYKQLLIGGIGIVSTLLVVSVVGVKLAYIRERDEKEFFPRVSLLFYEAGFVGVLILVPVLVLPFSLAMGYVIISILIAWGGIYFWDNRRRSLAGPKERHTPECEKCSTRIRRSSYGSLVGTSIYSEDISHMLLRPEDKSDTEPDYWWCERCKHTLLYSDWQKKMEQTFEKVGTKNRVSIKWNEKQPGKLTIVSLEKVGDRLHGTRRPKPISPENRLGIEQEIKDEIENVTGTKVGDLRDYFVP